DPECVADSLAECIGFDQNPQVQHDAVDVPDHKNPFLNEPEQEDLFFNVLAEVVRDGIIPAGYGLLPKEQVIEEDPDTEILSAGRCMKTKFCVSLANLIWGQRATLWVQALSVLS
ncbi:hypothetical protein K438DRAFT_1495251, partial [Mycena galopus ATCC 62051]